MGEAIFFTDQKVPARGLDQRAFPDEEKVKNYFFREHFSRLAQLEPLSPLPLAKEEPVLFYPGCGADVLSPLIYLEKLFPKLEKATFLFYDLSLGLNLIKTVLFDVGVSFEEKNTPGNNAGEIRFYWKNALITLRFVAGNVFLLEMPSFDIYFERGFGIFKQEKEGYEQRVFDRLNSGGLIISDEGFQVFPLRLVAAPPELSAYKEMIIGIKC